MRFFKKGPVPRALRVWMKENAGSCRYANLPSDVKSEIRRSLLSEQGFLDAYTMQRISEETCHIEHFRPQSHFPEASLDYTNMHACWPPLGVSGVRAAYGAAFKSDSTAAICSPLKESDLCEAFEYRLNGEMLPLTELARKTIEVLNLNAAPLREQRRQAILGALRIRTHRTGRRTSAVHAQLSIKAAKRVLDDIRRSDEEGRLQPFCAAIEQVIRKWAERAEKKSARLKKKPS